MKILNFILFLVALLALAACTGSRKMAKRADKLDASGMYTEAAELYLQSALRNANNVDAKLGLKRAGQQLLDDKLGQFFKAANMGNDPLAAVDAYLDAKEWADRAKAAGVQLEIPEHYTSDFQASKGAALIDLYAKGQAFLAAKDFTRAQAQFARIAELEPGYKDAASLQAIAYLEPLYQSAGASMAQGNYREAVSDLDRILARNTAYKNAAELRSECITKGRVSVAVLQGSSGLRRPSLKAPALQAMAISALAGLNDPFLSVVDRDDLQRLLDEQKLNMSGMVDESTAVGAGKLIAAQVVLICTLMEYHEETGTVLRSTREAYLGTPVSVRDSVTGLDRTTTEFKPVNFTENKLENKATLSFSYKLVNLETGEVLLSQVVDQAGQDRSNYAYYNGDVKALYPKVNGAVSNDSRARRDLAALFSAPQTPQTAQMLGAGLLRSTTGEMAQQVQQVISTRMQ
ncbi:MAG: hypothetical protein IPN44_00665 [Flavobacteriales bacterium]|nr:hypothetical protein [Flavobacteriales bacterium]